MYPAAPVNVVRISVATSGGGRLVIAVRANQRAIGTGSDQVRSANYCRSEGIADVRFVPFDRGGGATAKAGEAHICGPVAVTGSPEEEMLVRNLAESSWVYEIEA